MSITLYSGTPGSYKSYHAVADILQWLSWGRNVISNFPVNFDNYFKKNKKIGEFYYIKSYDLTVDYLVDFAKLNHNDSLKSQTLIVIDEASMLFNSRQFNNQDRMQWIEFFSTHRHFRFEIILICQQDRMLDRQIRGLIETEFKHRALKNWNLLPMMLLSIICGGLYHSVEYWYPCKIKVSTTLKKFNKKIGKCYDTMALFSRDDDSNKNFVQKNIQKIQKINKNDNKTTNVEYEKNKTEQLRLAIMAKEVQKSNEIVEKIEKNII